MEIELRAPNTCKTHVSEVQEQQHMQQTISTAFTFWPQLSLTAHILAISCYDMT